MRRSKRLLFFGVPALVALAIGFAIWIGRKDDSLERVRSAGVLRIGYAIEAPFAMIGPDGRITGESPETAREIAKRLGVARTEWVQLRFEALIPDLRDRRLDVIAAGLFVTKERARKVRFSDPTVRVAPGLLVLRGNPQRLGSFESLTAGSNAKVAVLAGSVEEERLRARGWDGEKLVVVPDAQAGRAALAQGIVDAIALSLPTLRWIAKSSRGSYEVLADPPKRNAAGADFVAFAFHPADAALQRAWNGAQSEFIGSPEHLRTISRFGFEASNLAADVHTSEVLRK
ncbi:MAG: ectoine/hydroxyectoine ABC transporter substrate-binding protein EhuB [Steroidobacter sp.]